MKKKALLAVPAIVAGALAVTGNVMYNIAIKAGGNRDAIFRAEENQTENGPVFSEPLEIGYEDAWTYSQDGLRLHAYVTNRESDVFVIAMHGYNLNGKTTAGKESIFNDRGYNILCPDCRGQGESEGSYIGMGWHDRKDIVSWIDYLNDRYAPSSIILYGVSMGGAAVMMAAGEKLPVNVKCIVEDCGYVSVKEEFRHEGKVVFGIPYYPLVWAGSIVTKIRAGWSFEEASAIEGLKHTRIPIMFIHGTDDKFVPVNHAYKGYSAAAGEKEIYIVPGAEHAQAQEVDGEKYWNRVGSFIDRYLEAK